MKRMFRNLIKAGLICQFLGLGSLLVPIESYAHSARHMLIETHTVVFEVFFSNGSPMAFAAVKVFSPGDQNVPYQTGRTDAGGRFAFVPSSEGMWRAEVDDGMGHKREISAEVRADQSLPLRKKPGNQGDAP